MIFSFTKNFMRKKSNKNITTGSIAIDNLGNFSIIPVDAMKGKNISIGQRVINNGTPTSVAPVVTHM